MTMDNATLRAPPGFAAHTRTSPLTAPWEPIFARETDGALVLGLFICARPTPTAAASRTAA
jgi:hypothetical protein